MKYASRGGRPALPAPHRAAANGRTTSVRCGSAWKRPGGTCNALRIGVEAGRGYVGSGLMDEGTAVPLTHRARTSYPGRRAERTRL